MFREYYEQALSESGEDSHFAFRLQNLFRLIKEEEGLRPHQQEELEELEHTAIPELLQSAEAWYQNGSFDDARRALDIIDDLLDDFDHIDAYWVCSRLRLEQVELKASLSGHDPSDELSEALDFVEGQVGSHSPPHLAEFTELILRNTDSITYNQIHHWIEAHQLLAEEDHAGRRYQHERDKLRQIIQLKQLLDAQIEQEQQRLVESYEANAEMQAERSMHLKALMLEEGLDECIEFLDQDRQDRWAREAQEARREAIENEMTEIELDEELLDQVVEESEDNVDQLVQWFERTAKRYDSSTNALYCLLRSDGYVPNFSQARVNSTGSVQDIFGLDIMSPEGHSYRIGSSINEDEDEDGGEESLPTGYRQQVGNFNSILTNALYRLIEQGTLTEFDFHTLFSVARLSVSTHAFLTDAVIDLFEENYVQSFAVAMPHFEGALVDTAENAGSVALVTDGDGTRQREFGGLIGAIRDDIDFEYGKYLETYYTSRQGTNLRNRWSHGQMRYPAVHFGTAVTVLFDTLKAVIQLHSGPFVYSAGLPMETISTTGDTTVDFTRFIGSDEKPLGYVFDGPKGLVITEDQNREWTSFIVLAGGMHDNFEINEIGLSHEEIRVHIDDLQEDDVLDLREDIEITWLDTQDARRNQVLALIGEHANGGSVGRSRVVEQASGFAFDDEEIETLIGELESEGDIRVEDDRLYLTG